MRDTRLVFHSQLDEIRSDLIRLAALVTEALPRATDVLLHGDLGEAERLITGDDPIDVLALQIEERSFQLLSLQQPMASDLRAIVTAMRLAAEIERSGDLVTNIAKAARRIYGTELEPNVRGLLQQMSNQAVRLMRLAIDAYADNDAGLASALDDIDDDLDASHNDYIEAVLNSSMQGSLDVQAAVQLAVVGRYYERIGDHAVNIGERVIFQVTGWLPEHNSMAREALRQRLDELDAKPDGDDLAAGAGGAS